jgi:hypothetical protein
MLCGSSSLHAFFAFTQTGMNKGQHERIRLPRKVDLPLALLRKELCINHFFYGLEQLGLGEYPHQPSLCTLILELMHLDAEADAVINFYVRLLQVYTKKIGPLYQPKRAHALALRFYKDLQCEQKRRQKAKNKVR